MAGRKRNSAEELKELREQNSKLTRLLAHAEPEKDALREAARGRFQAQPTSAAPSTCS
ncbi:hypothetical protein [Rhodococcus pyridinivorans]|uniref:hypothetical protein n=1 Tax=Rhodococcus pyridinivorans TaxID=103816 RepID=UPI002283B3F5|nr:hypothetical protein [Rhodococcus pyridinivorans]WAL49294.1 hypothetical protein OQN32_26875 [Rhodococcus pyridinivorans]